MAVSPSEEDPSRHNNDVENEETLTTPLILDPTSNAEGLDLASEKRNVVDVTDDGEDPEMPLSAVADNVKSGSEMQTKEIDMEANNKSETETQG